MRRVLVPCLLGGALLLPAIGAGDEPLELAWDAPKGCPTQPEVLAEVARIVGTGEVRRNLRAEAQVTQREGRWVVTLRTVQGGGEGERTLEGRTCKAVSSAVALVLALTLQTEAIEAPPPSASASSSAPPASSSAPLPSASASIAPPPSASVAPPRTPLALVMRASGGVALGTVPGAGGLASVGGGLRWKRFQVGASFTYVAETSQAIASRPAAGGQFSLLAASLTACLAPVAGEGAFEVWGCVGGEGEWMLARAYGVTTPNEAAYGWFAPILVPRLAYVPTRKLAVYLEGVFAIPLERPRFTVEGLEPVYRVPPMGLRLALGVELRF